MNWNRLAENWNAQVTKLCNWTINRLERVADKGDVKAKQRYYQLPLIKPREYVGQE